LTARRVGRLRRSLKYEHLYQREIANAAELAEEVTAYLRLYNEIRPYESRALEPRSVPVETHLLRGKVSKILDSGQFLTSDTAVPFKQRRTCPGT
jgi:hypothetical protein